MLEFINALFWIIMFILCCHVYSLSTALVAQCSVLSTCCVCDRKIADSRLVIGFHRKTLNNYLRTLAFVTKRQEISTSLCSILFSCNTSCMITQYQVHSDIGPTKTTFQIWRNLNLDQSFRHSPIYTTVVNHGCMQVLFMYKGICCSVHWWTLH